MATHPNIDRVNELLKQIPDLPSHRQRIDASGHNLSFVRKIVPKNPNAPAELVQLLALKDKELMKKAA